MAKPNAKAAPKDAVLVTGFEPFDGEKTNPSWEICERLPREIAGMRVHTCLVPCEFRRAIEVAAGAVERTHPLLVISLGQAGGRARLGIERVAINVDDARIPDNTGHQPVDELVAANGPPAYFATIPVKAMAAAVRAAGVPAEVSNTAGTFVCNNVFYALMDMAARQAPQMRAGFLHIPYAAEQAARLGAVPSMSLDDIVRGIEIVVSVSAARTNDLHVAEGAIS